MGMLGSGIACTTSPLLLAYSVNITRSGHVDAWSVLAVMGAIVMLVPLLDIWPELIVFFACYFVGTWLNPSSLP
jgi:hypothetical protein